MIQQDDISQKVEEAMATRPKRHNLEPFRDSSRTRKLRLWLNIIFLVGAITGLIVYFNVDHETAKWILIVSLVFKFVELMLRILKI
jgi:phage shock protein PspC (stress-responsive transcriptional regulator)